MNVNVRLLHYLHSDFQLLVAAGCEGQGELLAGDGRAMEEG